MAVPDPRPPRRWLSPPPTPPQLLDGLPDLHPVLVAVLAQRGVADPEAARAFLAHDPGPDDPRDLPGVDQAALRIHQAIARREPIVVYGDFDADGLTATAVLLHTLRHLGARAQAHIPDRHRDGYDIQEQVLADLAHHGARLVVTVDCGIRALSALEFAARQGLDVIVTDHHAPQAALPSAVAVVHAGLPGSRYPHPDLAGVGIAYKLAQALLRVPGLPRHAPPEDATEDSLLDLVAIGTVGDVVPLLGENRSLVHRGLLRLRSAPRLGLGSLADVAELDLRTVSARDIAYVIAPRLNAAGRMGSAEPALSLLMTDDPDEAARTARLLDQQNEARRRATDAAVAAADTALAGRTDEPFLLHASPDIGLGITGLVAGRLANVHGRPAAVVRLDGEVARGSARSIPSYDVMAALDSVADLLERHGGHAGAAGFALARSRLPELERALVAHARQALAGREPEATLEIAAWVPPEALDEGLYAALAALEPYGEGNPRPILAVRGARVSDVRTVGRNHLRFQVDGAPGGPIGAIGFGLAGSLSRGVRRVDLAATLARDTWRARTALELRVADVVPLDP